MAPSHVLSHCRIPVIAETVHVDYMQGVLTVTLPKQERAKPRAI
jgi:HSP20 family molecular chaperone IbpA